jgi:hypothetical protein
MSSIVITNVSQTVAPTPSTRQQTREILESPEGL